MHTWLMDVMHQAQPLTPDRPAPHLPPSVAPPACMQVAQHPGRAAAAPPAPATGDPRHTGKLRLPACPPTRLPACLPACPSACLPARLCAAARCSAPHAAWGGQHKPAHQMLPVHYPSAMHSVQCQAPPGRTYWSDPVELDALGGAAVVTVPSPLLPPTAAIPAARAAYQMSGVRAGRGGRQLPTGLRPCVNACVAACCSAAPAELPNTTRYSLPAACLPAACPAHSDPRPCAVTASQVPGSGGGLALYLLPRYLLTNTLDVPIQYKQQVLHCTRGVVTKGIPGGVGLQRRTQLDKSHAARGACLRGLPCCVALCSRPAHPFNRVPARVCRARSTSASWRRGRRARCAGPTCCARRGCACGCRRPVGCGAEGSSWIPLEICSSRSGGWGAARRRAISGAAETVVQCRLLLRLPCHGLPAGRHDSKHHRPSCPSQAPGPGRDHAGTGGRRHLSGIRGAASDAEPPPRWVCALSNRQLLAGDAARAAVQARAGSSTTGQCTWAAVRRARDSAHPQSSRQPGAGRRLLADRMTACPSAPVPVFSTGRLANPAPFAVQGCLPCLPADPDCFSLPPSRLLQGARAAGCAAALLLPALRMGRAGAAAPAGA